MAEENTTKENDAVSKSELSDLLDDFNFIKGKNNGCKYNKRKEKAATG